MVSLRQVILDSFWSRERSTVQENLNLVQSSLIEGEAMGLGGKVYPTVGPFPIGDRSGVAIACIMMQCSLKQRKMQ